jgi:predicted nucleotidyltransferase
VLWGFGDFRKDVDFLIEKGNKSFSLLKLSSFLQEVQSVLNLSVDVVTTSGIAEDFRKSIMGSEILIYEE